MSFAPISRVVPYGTLCKEMEETWFSRIPWSKSREDRPLRSILTAFQSNGFSPNAEAFWCEIQMIGKILIIIMFVALAPAYLGGCVALSDGKFVTKDGKQSPFMPTPDRYAPPKDPTSPF